MSRYNSDGTPAYGAATSTKIFALSGQGSGAFYAATDTACTGSHITSVSFTSGYQASFHFMDSTAQTVTITTSSTPAETGTYTPGTKTVIVYAPLSIATSSLPAATAGAAYSAKLAATGGIAPYSWSVASGSLPSGLALSSSGTVSGTPSVSGSFSFTAKVSDSRSTPNTATKAYSLSVSPAAPIIPTTLFGMQTHGSLEWPTVSFGLLGKGSQTLWPYIETSRGVRNWSNLDGYVSAAASAGIPMIYTFEFTPKWAIAGASSATCETLYTGALACPQPPDNMTDWTNFVSALVARYCPAGVPKIQYYELWNEPYDTYGTNHVQLSPANLAKMTHAAYGIIRSKCPAAKIISPSMATVTGTNYYLNYAQSYFQALGAVGTDPVDVAAVHIYAYNEAVNTPEDLASGGALNNSAVRSLINTYAPGKPIWNTEGSWQGSKTGLFDTENLHAAFIARWYLMHWSNGFSQANWYAWDDGSLGTLCVHISGTNNCSPDTIPVTAYQQTYDWMVGNRMTSHCAPLSSGSSVWSCGLTSAGGIKTVAIWNTAGSSTYAVPAGYGHYKTLAGPTSNAITSGSVTLGPEPILLTP